MPTFWEMLGLLRRANKFSINPYIRRKAPKGLVRLQREIVAGDAELEINEETGEAKRKDMKVYVLVETDDGWELVEVARQFPDNDSPRIEAIKGWALSESVKKINGVREPALNAALRCVSEELEMFELNILLKLRELTDADPNWHPPCTVSPQHASSVYPGIITHTQQIFWFKLQLSTRADLNGEGDVVIVKDNGGTTVYLEWRRKK
jgi:hypothetical protein